MIKVYWGNAKRGEVEDIFGNAYKGAERVFFAWKKSGWKTEHQYVEDYMAVWSREYTLIVGIAQRTIRKNASGDKRSIPWKVLHIGTNRSGEGFDPAKDMIRAARYFDQLGMPIEVAKGYVDACSRMVEQIRCWDEGVETPPEWNIEDNRPGKKDFGLRVPGVSKN